MTEKGQSDEMPRFLEAASEWITSRNIERIEGNSREGVVRIKVPISEGQSLSASIVFLNSGVVLFTILDVVVGEEQFDDLVLLTNAINIEIPFGSFNVDPRDNFIFYRDTTRIALNAYHSDSLDAMFFTIGFNIRKYQTLLKAVAEGLLDGKEAIAKLKSESD